LVKYTLRAASSAFMSGAEPFHIWRLPGGAAWAEFRRTPWGYHLRFPDFAEFQISADGGHVDGFPAPGIESATVEHLYLNQVLPLALGRRGKLVIHASAVDVNGEALAFLAESGRGKSTLAAALAMKGYRFLSDDSLVIETEGGQHFALPSHPSIRLWQDSEAHLLDKDAVKAPPVSYTSKMRFLAGDALTYCREPRRLRAAYVLGPGEASAPVIKPISGAESFIAWTQQAFVLDMEDRAQISEHFEAATRLAAEIPCFDLDYPRSFARLPETLDAIIRHAAHLDGK
jgi:hypothetical protein